MLTDERIERYARHILLREVGGIGQSRLLGCSVHLKGLGAVGEWAAAYLALAGVGKLRLEDSSPVDPADAGPILAAAAAGQSREAALALALPGYNPDPEILTGAADAVAGAEPGLAAMAAAGAAAAAAAAGVAGVAGVADLRSPGSGGSRELIALLGDGQVLTVRAGGERFVLCWRTLPDDAPDVSDGCILCIESWLGQGLATPSTAALAGSLAAGEILGRTLGIGSVPAGARWYEGGLPSHPAACTHN